MLLKTIISLLAGLWLQYFLYSFLNVVNHYRALLLLAQPFSNSAWTNNITSYARHLKHSPIVLSIQFFIFVFLLPLLPFFLHCRLLSHPTPSIFLHYFELKQLEWKWYFIFPVNGILCSFHVYLSTFYDNFYLVCVCVSSCFRGSHFFHIIFSHYDQRYGFFLLLLLSSSSSLRSIPQTQQTNETKLKKVNCVDSSLLFRFFFLLLSIHSLCEIAVSFYCE